ncbi:chemotaxis protein-glutamate methylesterase [Salinimicrobium marinum]|uniref:protein-glutamate methylesterase n=1 Tax=Salinimicrobium marinum TaxID=680283 RepID=A0A918SCX5_9FLAO|nr:chemotaxis protein CheB [Salinimicrobium marinum]GHA33224.1 chemotaxis protein-glutamate methylesterase [Salinimicrobium marinum]
MSDLRNIIVIGSSAGGIPATKKVINGLTDKMDLAVVVVIHVSQRSRSEKIAGIFQNNTSLHCEVAANGMPVEKGHLYVAPPEHQLMVKDDILILNHGPHENKYRPSIDVLFRSAAVNYGNRVIGIILTGLFEDGTSGMSAIKRSGGLCIIQDPSEAEFSDMPRSVKNKITVDYEVRLQDMPNILEDILNKPLPLQKLIPRELQIEAEITEKMMSNIDEVKKIADHSDFVCPDCGGGLWKIKNDPTHRYRCHTGHVYTENLLKELQDQNIEESIWVSIRMLEEKENLLLLIAKRQNEEGEEEMSSINLGRLNDTRKHIDRLRSLLSKLNEDLHRKSAN